MFFFSLKKYAKKILIRLEKVVPQSTFDKFYSFVFPKYKTLLRVVYRTKSIVYLLAGNKQGREMVKEIYQVIPYTLVGTGGLEVTYKLARMANEKGIEGNFVELGVARGGCAALMASVAFGRNNCVERQIWLFDSFEGLPDPTEDDFCLTGARTTGDHLRPLSKGSCMGTLHEVQDLFFNKYRFPRDKVFFVKGWFQDTLLVKRNDVGRIAILRIDADWYTSTKCCLEYLYDYVVDGGAVIIDDYQSCFGCKKAVDEFLANRDLNVNMLLDGRGGCYFVKP